jgi:hypothetical protein
VTATNNASPDSPATPGVFNGEVIGGWARVRPDLAAFCTDPAIIALPCCNGGRTEMAVGRAGGVTFGLWMGSS